MYSRLVWFSGSAMVLSAMRPYSGEELQGLYPWSFFFYWNSPQWVYRDPICVHQPIPAALVNTTSWYSTLQYHNISIAYPCREDCFFRPLISGEYTPLEDCEMLRYILDVLYSCLAL